MLYRMAPAAANVTLKHLIMKPTEVAFLAVVVIFRTAALAAVLFGLFITAMPLLGFVASISTQVILGLLRVLLVYLAAGGILWMAAKPAASLVTRGLDEKRS